MKSRVYPFTSATRVTPTPDPKMPAAIKPSPATSGFAVFALALLGLSLLWHVPMMLWDHLDLVPILQAWREGRLLESDFWSFHGGHMHALAYAVLLVTTTLSSGQPWLDTVVSWTLLATFAAIVVRLAAASVPVAPARQRWLLCVAFLALYPGHLVNLQWGWQVAVFLCLLGVAVVVRSLGAPKLTWWLNASALVAAVLAYFSFATAAALVPVAVAMIVARRDLSHGRRTWFAAPWLGLGLLIAYRYQSTSLILASDYSAWQLVQYTLNFLGAGISRFATDLAPWLALAALVTGIQAFVVARHERVALYWWGLFLFAIASALLTGLGRAGPFGADHAFVTRYVSFSSLFWLGWLGLSLIAMRCSRDGVGRWRSRLAVVMMVFAVGNALHMVKQAQRVGENTREIARQVRETHPDVDPGLLAGIYFEQPLVADARLQTLRDWSFPPFAQAPDRSAETPR